jgi:cell wall-associated NlpC family hydrolase
VVPVGAGGAVGPQGPGSTPGGSGIVDGTAAQRLEQAALNMMGTETCYVSNTGSGRRACAYVVNAIVDEALGAPIDGTSGNGNSYGRTTADMYRTLSTSNRFMLVGSNISQLQPGDIIISPTSGSNTGHVGIHTSSGNIISNSSSATEVDDRFSPTRWQNYYSGTKGLNTYIFRPAQVLGN